MSEQSDNPFRGLLRLETATRRVLSQVCEELEARGFDIAEVTELALLGVVGEGCWMSDVRTNGWDMSQNVSRTAAKLRMKGYLDIREGIDRRQRRLALSDKGRAAIAVASPLAAELWEAECRELRKDDHVVLAASA